MTRVTIDIRKDRNDAAASLSSLRDVGLNAGDIGSAWPAPRENDDTASTPRASVAVHEVAITGLGPVHFTGWLAEIALKTPAGPDGSVDLGPVLAAASLDQKDITRTRDALLKGGGVIAVRARDALIAG